MGYLVVFGGFVFVQSQHPGSYHLRYRFCWSSLPVLTSIETSLLVRARLGLNLASHALSAFLLRGGGAVLTDLLLLQHRQITKTRIMMSKISSSTPKTIAMMSPVCR